MAIQGFAFVPNSVTVNVGDTVTWTNVDGVAHTSTSTTGVWNSGTLGPSGSFSFTFTAPGTFAYRCGLHPSMTGTVVAQGAATPPPTPVPTPIPTPRPTLVPTAIPTVAPTAAVTPAATTEPTVAASLSASPSASAPATTSSTPAASQSSASGAAAATLAVPQGETRVAASADAGPAGVLVAGAALIVLALVGGALVLLRR